MENMKENNVKQRLKYLLVETLKEHLNLPSQFKNKLNVDIWINREDVCVGCHNNDCEACEYVKYFKE